MNNPDALAGSAWQFLDLSGSRPGGVTHLNGSAVSPALQRTRFLSA